MEAGAPRFESKVDWWIGVLLVVPVIATLGTLIALYSSGADDAWTGWVGFGIVVLVYGGLVFPMYYVLESDHLLIRFGLARARVKYSEITGVAPTRNPLSSPALSLDRLHIQSGSSLGPNISPKDKAAFLREMAKRAPHLRLQDDRLVSDP